jgi:hypothetical protein
LGASAKRTNQQLDPKEQTNDFGRKPGHAARSCPIATRPAATAPARANSSYWDLGVCNDNTGPVNHGSGFPLNPLYGALTSTTAYSATDLKG